MRRGGPSSPLFIKTRTEEKKSGRGGVWDSHLRVGPAFKREKAQNGGWEGSSSKPQTSERGKVGKPYRTKREKIWEKGKKG